MFPKKGAFILDRFNRIPESTRIKIIRALCLLLPVAIYLVLASFHMGDLFTNDETWEFYASQTLLERGQPLTVTGEINVLHPHGYYYLVKMAFQLFSISEVAARSVGILAAILCYFILIRMVRFLRGEVQPRTYLLVGIFYLLSPLVVQGSLVITADTGLHQLVIMLFLLYFMERFPFNAVDTLVLPLLFALTLWVKFVNPCLVLFSLVLYFVLKWEWKRALYVAGVVGGGGLLIFLGIWTLQCLSLNSSPLDMFTYLWKVLGSRRIGQEPLARVIQMTRGALLVVVWMGIPFVLLILKALIHFTKTKQPAARRSQLGLLLVTGSVLLAGHTLVSGVGFGFPRYHFPLFPVWAVLVTIYLEEVLGESRWSFRGAALAITLPAAYLVFLVKDPLYILNYELKLTLLNLPDLPSHSIAMLAWNCVLFLLPLLAVVVVAIRLRSPSRTAAVLLLLSVSYSLYQNTLQARAAYATSYGYGENGTSVMISYCADRLRPGKKVLAPMDVVYHLQTRDYMEDWQWGRRDFLMDRIRDRDTQFVVMAVNHNTIGQIRQMHRDAGLRGILEKEYIYLRIGSYLLWERPVFLE